MKQRELRIISLLVLDTLFFFLEIIAGYSVHSLALVADAFHMLNDILSLVVALWAVRVSKSRGVDSKYTYGWQRAEILGALVNGVFLLALCLSIFLEAIQRLIEVPVVSNPKLILVVGCAGLLSNMIGLVLFHEHDHDHGHSHGHSHGHDDDEHEHDHDSHRHDVEQQIASVGHRHNFDSQSQLGDLLPDTAVARIADERTSLLAASNDCAASQHGSSHHHRSASTISETHVNHYHAQPKLSQKSMKSLNMEGVWLHVLGDALGNIGVIATALFIWKTDYSWKYYADPLISLVITAIIFSSALPLCRRSSSILLQGVPQSVNTEEVRADLESLDGVEDIHDLHIWILRENLFIATLHLSTSLDEQGFMDLAQKIRICLSGHGIHSITVQPEFVTSGHSAISRQSSIDSGSKCAIIGNQLSGV